MRSVKLNYHIPDENDLISYTSGLRPYRSEGIRLEKEIIKGKQIFHDYGHGGAGLTLGWGCAKYLINDVFSKSNHDLNTSIAILGGGIIGLSTAAQLVEKGYNVNLYANNFAYDTKANQPQITTTVAAGLWLPVKISSKASLKDLSIDTLNHYNSILEQQKKSNTKLGITQMQCYVVNDKQDVMCSSIKGFIPLQQLVVTFNGQQYYDCKVFKTIVIESFFYIPYIMKKLKQSGKFNIFQKTLNSIEDVHSLKEKVVFNCLGFGSNKIFPDSCQMMPVKGHITKFPVYPNVMNFILFMKIKDRWILQVPHQQKGNFNLGISFQQNNYNPFPQKQAIDLLIKTTRQFYIHTESRKTTFAKL